MDQLFEQKNAKMDPESLKSLENRVFGVFIPKLKFLGMKTPKTKNSRNEQRMKFENIIFYTKYCHIIFYTKYCQIY